LGRAAEEPPGGRGVGEKSGRPILVVDDDVDGARTFAMLLNQLGHAAEYATHPQSVAELARRLRPWLIFLDIHMPVTSGWELARELRRELGHEGLRLVAVSGSGEPGDHKRSREAGFDAHVLKPVDLDLLKSILAQIR